MESFTPVSAVIGGILIGLSAVGLMALNGRIAGISGIVGAAMGSRGAELGWRLAFVAGLFVGPWLVLAATGSLPPIVLAAPLPVIVAGGLLVGFGSRLGSGCTSGHGVCGLARLSPRSLAATLVFTVSGMAVVFVVRHLLGA
ncbi:MAG: YeeE/YedE family protein [Caulobacteraceae bacterium]